MSEHYDEAREIRKRSMLSFMNDEESRIQAKQMKNLLLEIEVEKEEMEILKFSLGNSKRKTIATTSPADDDDEVKREKKMTRRKQSLPSRRSERIAVNISMKDSDYNNNESAGKSCYDSDWLADNDDDYSDNDDDDNKRRRRRRSSSSSKWPKIQVRDLPVAVKKNVWGAVPGYPVGYTFTGRFEACRVGIHRSVVAGIHSDGNGAYSISVNTSYDDNEDHGWYLWYCGSGGRDLKTKNLRTAEQTKDMTLNRNIVGMKSSMEEVRELRVIRGPGSGYPLSGEGGMRYRYDGLYHIVEEEKMKNRKGLLVYRFRLVRIPGQDPLPFKLREEDYNADHQ